MSVATLSPVCHSRFTGKTTILAALLSAVDPGERLLVVEDAEELRPRHPHVVRLIARPANIDIEEKNLKSAYGADRSQELLLEVADLADDREYNEIIWKAVRGVDSPLPPRKIAAFVKARD